MKIYVKDNKALSLNSKLLSPAASGETWVLNAGGFIPIRFSQSASFISDGKAFSLIHETNFSMAYDNISVAERLEKVDSENLLWNAGSWVNDNYRTLIFATPPTGALLTWLQANAVKQ